MKSYFLPIFAAYSSFFHSTAVLAHMEMNQPFPIRSKFDPANKGGLVDYNMLRPLSTDGSNYPCFGYHRDVNLRTVATYNAGRTYTMKLSGSATHNGGSCQLSLSYDSGNSFRVIKSMIGGCPLTSSYDFTIPKSAPSGKALFAWTWFNKVGNREMYMNCASVEISGGGGARADGNAPGLSGKPEIFKANIFGNGMCKTLEGSDVVFKNKGDDVVYGVPALQGAAASELSGCPQGGSGGGSPSKPDPVTSSVKPVRPAAETFLAIPVAERQRPQNVKEEKTRPKDDDNVDNFKPIPTSNPMKMPSPPYAGPQTWTTVYGARPTANTYLKPSSGKVCVEGETRCDSSGSTWSRCASSSWADMGQVAEGTICKDGQIIRKASGKPAECSTPGQMRCGEDGKSWLVCNQGGWNSMGAISQGSICKDGKISPGSA